MSNFNAGDDTISVEDITNRVDELRGECDSIQEDIDSAVDDLEVDAAEGAMEEWTKENAEELETLESLLSEMCGYGGNHQWEGDWYPDYLTHENYFETAMDEMVADCYEIPKDLPSFMTITLDYDALREDYTEVEFDGQTYYYR